MFLQIITPLPSLDAFSGAVAKALFDFEGEEEPDLLTFKQVEYHVQRRKIPQQNSTTTANIGAWKSGHWPFHFHFQS